MTATRIRRCISDALAYARAHRLLVVLTGLFLLGNFIKWLRSDGDFDVYYAASMRFLQGASIHVFEPGAFTYPGVTAVLLAPVMVLGHDVAKIVFFVLSAAGLVLGVTLANRRLLGAARGIARWAFALSILFSLRFMLAVMDNQQTDLVIFALVILGAWAYQARSGLSPVCWGLATALKANPLFMVLLPVFHRRWRQVAAFAAVVLVAVMVPDLFKYAVDGEALPESFEVPTTVVAREGKPATREYSLSAVSADTFAYLREFVRLTTAPIGGGLRWWERESNPLNQSLTRIALYYLPPGVPATAVFWLLCGLFALALWRLARLPGAPVFGVAMLCYCAFVLIGPMSSKPHFVAVYPLLLVCWQRVLAARSWRAIAALALVCACMGLSTRGLLGDAADVLAVRGNIGLAALVLWAAAYRVLWREARTGEQPVPAVETGDAGGPGPGGTDLAVESPRIEAAPDVSVIIPTLREAGNIAALVEATDRALASAGVRYDVTVVDDDSRDGTEDVCRQLAAGFPLRLLVRRRERGLATAVLAGVAASAGRYVVVMDADQSHPPDAIPRLLRPLQADSADFVVGSRYVEGSSIDVAWTLSRRVTSYTASLLVSPLTRLADPLAGFFALRRRDLPDIGGLSPLGYKIGLELLVRGDFARVVEVPIHFAERAHGKSKLTFRESLLFLVHVARLLRYRYLRR